MSKGSKRRKPLVDSQTISDNWDRIFNQEKEDESETEEDSVQDDWDSASVDSKKYWGRL